MSGAADWPRAEPVLDELLDLDPHARAARLEELARMDPGLFELVSSALQDVQTEEILGRSAGELAAALFAGDDVVPARSGERVGPFRIREELGRGGMGAVYAAERVDGGFDQQVAIKVLKRGLDSEHVLRRFVAERRILARLEHPHIARLIDGGMTEDGLPWFALERVDGRAITEDADRRALDVRGRLALFLDVCEAVSFAHGQRIVHRDIKPSNVLVDARGQVKLLDFGIAKLLDPAEERLTRTSALVLTPKYAAPEQVSGGAITVATDVWQLGRLLDELLPASRTRDLQRILERATHEEAGRRYSSVAALADDVRRFLAGKPVLARGDSATYRLSRFLRRHQATSAAVALGSLVAVAWAISAWTRPDPKPAAALRFQLVSTFPGSHRQATFSPDGRSIAFLMEDAGGTPQVWTKDLGGGDPVQRTQDARGAHRPRWSPKGDQIVYDVPGQGIWSVPPGRGTARRLLEDGFNPNISPDGEQLVYEEGAYLWTARADGGGARRLGATAELALEKEYAFVESAPAFSADGREVVYFQDHDSPVTGDLWSIGLAGEQKRRLTADDALTSHPVAMPDGRGIVYSSSRRGGLTLWLLPSGGGEPRPLTTGTGEDTEAAISRDGRRLIYTNARNLLRLMWLDPKSGVKRQLLENRSVLTHPSFSPDGRRIAFFQGEARSIHIWTMGTDGSGLRQLTHGNAFTVLPNYSADGRWIYHYGFPPLNDFRRIPADGGPSEILVPGWRFSVEHGAHVSPDGGRVAYTLLQNGEALKSRVRDLKTNEEKPLAQPILWPRWSPDGALLAGRGRTRELTLCPASGAACRGLGVDGTEPRWSRDGRQIYFVRYSGYQGSRDPRVTPLWKVNVDGSSPSRVADLEGPSPIHFFYDISPTGEIAWASFVAGRQELWMADLPDGSSPR
jgi:Tol biopolymer transport system component